MIWVKVLLVVVALVGGTVGIWGYRTDHPFFAMVGALAGMYAVIILPVVTWPNYWFRQGWRK